MRRLAAAGLACGCCRRRLLPCTCEQRRPPSSACHPMPPARPHRACTHPSARLHCASTPLCIHPHPRFTAPCPSCTHKPQAGCRLLDSLAWNLFILAITLFAVFAPDVAIITSGADSAPSRRCCWWVHERVKGAITLFAVFAPDVAIITSGGGPPFCVCLPPLLLLACFARHGSARRACARRGATVLCCACCARCRRRAPQRQTCNLHARLRAHCTGPATLAVC